MYRVRRQAVNTATRSELALATLAAHQMTFKHSPHRNGERENCNACRPALADLDREFSIAKLDRVEVFALRGDYLVQAVAVQAKGPFWKRGDTAVQITYTAHYVERFDDEPEVIDLSEDQLRPQQPVGQRVALPVYDRGDFA